MYRTYDREIVSNPDNNIMTCEVFWEGVDNGCFSGYQGIGFWVKDDFTSYDRVFQTPQADATHVIWFNK